MALNIEQILKSIVKNPALVEYHGNWGYYIKVDFPSIHMIGLIPNDDGQLELSLYFGESQAQSREFYGLNPRLELLTKEWVAYCNFHLSNSFRNLFWFKTPPSTQVNEYVRFWQANRNLLYRHDRKGVTKLLNSLAEKGIIDFGPDTKRDFKIRILDQDYSQFNVCASLGVLYFIDEEEADRLGKKKQFGQLLIEKINQGLSIIGENGNRFLKSAEGNPPDF